MSTTAGENHTAKKTEDTMQPVEWSDTYSLGIEQIDEHHRHLFTLLNETYDLFVAEGKQVAVEKVIDELINYATYHLSSEEQLMSQISYTWAEDHLKEHAAFIQQIKTHEQDFRNGRKTLSLELIVFLQDWLLEHIIISDKALAEELIQRGMQGVRIELA
jgi:hemerythrin